jgi:hypothetical protein
MKNLMIYISPTGSFDNPRPDLASNDAGPLAKVAIENSLALGWKKEDIMFVTNFPYQYGDVKTIVLDDVPFFERKPQGTKINTIIRLYEKGMVKKDEIYWFHDLDAFQLQPLFPNEVKIAEDEIAITDYGGIKFAGVDRFSTGVIFFKSGSKDIFDLIKKVMYEKSIDEEEALGLICINDKKIAERVKKLNNSYNFIGYYFRSCYNRAIKPLKVVHFHPDKGRRRAGIENCLRFFSGENPINTPLLTDNLIKIFNFHRIK